MEESKYKWNEFGEIECFEDLNAYFANREYKHGDYYHYTSLSAIDSIVGNREFRLSNVSGFNDKRDREQFKGIENSCYSLCFSTGKNENLPLWYLYSGIDGKGGRIRFTKAMVRKLVKEGVYTLCEYDEINKKKGNVILQLNPNNANITFKDVLYTHYNENEISFKYCTMTNYKFSRNEYDKVAENWNYFLKGVIWYYEKETRLLVRLKGEAAEIAKKKKCIVTLSFPQKLNYSIGLAPNISDFSEVMEHKHILEYGIGKAVSFSKYVGEIDMDLCHDCEHKMQKNRGE